MVLDFSNRNFADDSEILWKKSFENSVGSEKKHLTSDNNLPATTGKAERFFESEPWNDEFEEEAERFRDLLRRLLEEPIHKIDITETFSRCLWPYSHINLTMSDTFSVGGCGGQPFLKTGSWNSNFQTSWTSCESWFKKMFDPSIHQRWITFHTSIWDTLYCPDCPKTENPCWKLDWGDLGYIYFVRLSYFRRKTTWKGVNPVLKTRPGSQWSLPM